MHQNVNKSAILSFKNKSQLSIAEVYQHLFILAFVNNFQLYVYAMHVKGLIIDLDVCL